VVLPLCYKKKEWEMIRLFFKEETQPHTSSIFSQMPKRI
jgi:hypothetical protein